MRRESNLSTNKSVNFSGKLKFGVLSANQDEGMGEKIGVDHN